MEGVGRSGEAVEGVGRLWRESGGCGGSGEAVEGVGRLWGLYLAISIHCLI